MNKTMTRRLAFVTVFTSACVASRISMAALPNVTFVTFLTAISGIIGGPMIGFLVGALSMFASDSLFFSVGFWTLVTSSSMGLVGVISGMLWSRRINNPPSKLELGVLGYLITLMYDILTSLVTLPILMHVVYSAPAATLYAISSLLIGLFLPLGGFLWPAGPVHEFITAILLALATPSILRRVGKIGF